MVAVIVISVVILIIIGKIFWSSPKFIGLYGEKRVARKLDWLPSEYVTLNDVLLPTRYGTSQIDHIVVSPYGIFVIETKNYKGWILGHEKSEEWKQSLVWTGRYGKTYKEQNSLRNPILQNESHIRAIKYILKGLGDFEIIPIVVFSDNATLKITTPNYIVINWNRLRSTIKSFKIKHLSQNDIHKIVNKINISNITSKDARENHVRNVQFAVNANKNREQAIANRVCPKCGGRLVLRDGRYGSFWGCSNYPACTFTYNQK